MTTSTKQPRQIAFTTDKRQRPIAYRWCRYALRWIRVGLDDAKVQIATGEAIEVPYINVRKPIAA